MMIHSNMINYSLTTTNINHSTLQTANNNNVNYGVIQIVHFVRLPIQYLPPSLFDNNHTISRMEFWGFCVEYSICNFYVFVLL